MDQYIDQSINDNITINVTTDNTIHQHLSDNPLTPHQSLYTSYNSNDTTNHINDNSTEYSNNKDENYDAGVIDKTNDIDYLLDDMSVIQQRTTNLIHQSRILRQSRSAQHRYKSIDTTNENNKKTIIKSSSVRSSLRQHRLVALIHRLSVMKTNENTNHTDQDNCTFHPVINSISNKYNSSITNKFSERLKIYTAQYHKKLEQIPVVPSCTFTPDITQTHNHSRTGNTSHTVYERLNSDMVQRKLKLQQLTDKHYSQYTHQPQINTNKKSIYNNNNNSRSSNSTDTNTTQPFIQRYQHDLQQRINKHHRRQHQSHSVPTTNRHGHFGQFLTRMVTDVNRRNIRYALRNHIFGMQQKKIGELTADTTIQRVLRTKSNVSCRSDISYSQQSDNNDTAGIYSNNAKPHKPYLFMKTQQYTDISNTTPDADGDNNNYDNMADEQQFTL